MKYIKYLDRMLSGKVIKHPRELAAIVADKTRHHKVAVRDFLKFLIEKGYFTKSQIIDYQEVVKLERTGIRPASQAFTTTDKIIQAYEYLKSINSKKIVILKLLTYSGLRLTEACDLLSNFRADELAIMEDKGIARYDLLAMYKRIGSSKARAEVTKRAWVAYMPLEFAKQLMEICPLDNISEEALKGKRFAKGIVLPNQFRKWFSNHLKDLGVPERVIEFMTGKTSERVLRQFYFDLLKEADEWYSRIVDKFPIGGADA